MRALLLSILILLAGCQTTRETAPPSQPTVSTESLAAHFEAIAFGADERMSLLPGFNPDALQRWTGPIRWFLRTRSLAERNRYLPLVQKRLAEIAELTGLETEEAFLWQEANFVVWIEDLDAVRSTLRASGPPYANLATAQAFSYAPCFALLLHDRTGRLLWAVLPIAPGLDDKLGRICVNVEITQAIGIGRDAAVILPSIASHDRPEIDYVPWYDDAALWLQYRPELRLGMSRAEAMPIVQQLIKQKWQD